MSDLSTYLKNKLVDHFTGVAPYTAPATLYASVYTVAPTDDGGGTEVTGSGYARQEVTFDAADAGEADSDVLVSFTAVGGNFGTIVHGGLHDALTGGNLLTHKAITPVTINDNDTLDFPIADIKFKLD